MGEGPKIVTDFVTLDAFYWVDDYSPAESPAPNEALNMENGYTYCSEVSCRHPQLMTPDRRILRVLLLDGQPPIVRDPTGQINGGKPTSVYDLLYEQDTGTKLPKDKHAVPALVVGEMTRDYSSFDSMACQLLTAAQIHGEYTGKGGRGRRLSLGVKEAATIKSRYYGGKGTLSAVASEANVSEAQAGLIVRGRRYWYS